jgi:hypothetical protein
MISRLEVVTREIDRVFGDCYAAAHPEVVVVSFGHARVDQNNNVSECVGATPSSDRLSLVIAPNRPSVSPLMPSVK